MRPTMYIKKRLRKINRQIIEEKTKDTKIVSLYGYKDPSFRFWAFRKLLLSPLIYGGLSAVASAKTESSNKASIPNAGP